MRCVRMASASVSACEATTQNVLQQVETST